MGHIVLQSEDVAQRAFVSLRPQVRLILHLNQLGGDAYAVARAPDTALENEIHPQFPADLVRRLRGVLVLHGRGAGDHSEPLRLHPRQLRDHFFGQTVAEEFLLRVGTQVHERHHGQHDFARWRTWFGPNGIPGKVAHHSENP
ncbi:MAG: hypothetical protein ACRD5G_05340 [Candidatus Acidiferrales bacterium]